MFRVFVLDHCQRSLMPCSRARARILLAKGHAKVFRRFPFTIILTKREVGVVQEVECKVDPGSKQTGISGEKVFIPKKFLPLNIIAEGRGSRQMCRMDKYGFPRTTSKQQKRVAGFQTGDLVKAVVTSGKKEGTFIGRVAVRLSGYFNIKTKLGMIQGIHYKYCVCVQKIDGYSYAY